MHSVLLFNLQPVRVTNLRDGTLAVVVGGCTHCWFVGTEVQYLNVIQVKVYATAGASSMYTLFIYAC